MNTSELKKFALKARNSLIEQVSAKLELVLAKSSAARRESAGAIKSLEKEIERHGKEQVLEKVAYIWFNRFCALRFMDVNRYTRVGVVSPAEDQLQPELLAEAKMGHIDIELAPDNIRQQIFALLTNKSPSHDPQGEAYRLLVVAACNYWHQSMPFLFDRIDNYTELLMPDDLLSECSILAYTREALTPETCQNVEIIGWLYQFYIYEKKEEVFEGLNNNRKITPENIPAATQLFTPRWIVRYLVENSLGRLWMLNHPHSKLIEQMDYYIKPEQPESDFLHINKPEEIKICDPACGSGHMLVYAFDLLYAIYEEEGYEPAEISKKILTHNLYGIEIDERAGELAAFALTMKARARQRSFFRNPVQPNICVLEKVQFDDSELNDYMDFVGRKLFTEPLEKTLRQFEEANNFGSLIQPKLVDVKNSWNILKAKKMSGQLFFNNTHHKVLHVLKQAEYLSSKYHVVIANPPYMGGKGMNTKLQEFAKINYPASKADLFSMFMERNLELTINQGLIAMITMQSWMFLSSFETLRKRLIEDAEILSMAHLGTRAFDSIGGEVVSTTAFVLENSKYSHFEGSYLRLVDGNSEAEKDDAMREAVKNKESGYFYHTSAANFKQIPGCPIAYWVSDKFLSSFKQVVLRNVADAKQGMATSNNERFLRFWHEISKSNSCFDCKSASNSESRNEKWYAYNKGGTFRRWYGNNEYLVNWQRNGEELKVFVEEINKLHPGGRLKNQGFYFLENITYSALSSGSFSARYNAPGFLFDTKGSCIFPKHVSIHYLISFLNTNVAQKCLNVLCPTLDYSSIGINAIPIILIKANFPSEALIAIAKLDWDSYETSWGFTNLPLLSSKYHQPSLISTYNRLRTNWQNMTLEMKRMEEENNSIFIEAYGLQNELTPEVPLKEITLTCNPQHRYGGNKCDDELEALLLADTMKEFISYAVGCMFGRYALEKPGLILANQGETFKDYLKQIPKSIFPACEDNVIPILEGDWFSDDISERFREFLRITFGEERYEENLRFIENAIGKDIRKYFLKDFYNDHLKRYKKRPIYWLFSSPKGNFNALIYMHRYRPDNVSIILNDYLREFGNKLSLHLDHLERVEASSDIASGEKTKALKEIEKLKKIIYELDTYEREVLYPLASKQLKIELDDGVKINYTKFGAALRKIPGLEIKGES